MRNNMVFAEMPVPPVMPNDSIKHVATPSMTETQENETFVLALEHTNSCFECVTNLKKIDNASENEHMQNSEFLKDEKLSSFVRSRLAEYLSSHSKIDINDLHWQFFHNIDMLRVMMKILKLSVPDDMLQSVEYHRTLLSCDFHKTHL